MVVIKLIVTCALCGSRQEVDMLFKTYKQFEKMFSKMGKSSLLKGNEAQMMQQMQRNPNAMMQQLQRSMDPRALATIGGAGARVATVAIRFSRVVLVHVASCVRQISNVCRTPVSPHPRYEYHQNGLSFFINAPKHVICRNISL